MDMWLYHRGYTDLSRDNIQDVCCAIMFNTMAYLYKILKDERKEKMS